MCCGRCSSAHWCAGPWTGVTRLVGHVLKGNEAMQGMMTAMGYTLGEGDSRDTDPWVKDISIPTNLL